MEVSPIVLFLTTKVLSTEVFAVILGLIALHVCWKRGYLFALAVAGSSLFLSLLVTGVKNLIKVERPAAALVEISSYAFPSGHAAGAAFFALMLEWYLRTCFKVRRLALMRMLLVGFVVGVGYSRLFLQVHTVEQVLAGCIVGTLVGGAFQYSVFMLSKHDSDKLA